jgi:hypothetical protein
MSDIFILTRKKDNSNTVLNCFHNSKCTVAGLGFFYAELSCTTTSEACGKQKSTKKVLKKTHTPFDRLIQAHSPKVSFFSLQAKPHPLKRVHIIITQLSK